MTVMTTSLALIPLALSAVKPGSELESSMAAAIFCGLIAATFLNLVPSVPSLRSGDAIRIWARVNWV
ncbi:hypothetical protein GF348_12660 [candidate division KSB3 bacterium]|nr:hypothetical protein [candidate division KSB3 bacterium]